MGNAPKRQGSPGIGRVVASRMLVDESRSHRKLEVRIGIPVPDGTGDWRCAYHVRGMGMRSPRWAFGVDSIQALIQALEAVRHDLDAAGVASHWAGGERGDHGFPRYVPMVFGSRLSQRINRLIERELAQHVKRLEASARGLKRRKS